MDSPKRIAQHLRASKPTFNFDARTLQKLKEQALAKARRLQEQATASTAGGLAGARVAAQDIASSRNAREAGAKAWTLWRSVEGTAAVTTLARLLICACFVNMIWDDYAHWRHMHSPELLERRRIYPHRFPPLRFPWLGVLVFAPCAVLAGLGLWVPVTASVMTLDMIWNSAALVWHQLLLLLRYGQRPNELIVKKLALLGCVAAVLAHAVKGKQQAIRINAYAGMLLHGERRSGPGAGRSLVLLIGRLLMCLLFLYVGWMQISRVIQRDWALFRKHDTSVWLKDGHDNNWLLLECVLALPFAIGLKTTAVSRLLAAALVLEAVTCWPVWDTWPSWQYAAHVRVHFLTNLAVAGGLILLQSLGAGRFTVDQLISKKGS